MGAPALPPGHCWLPLVRMAIAEDVRAGDVTSELVLSPDARGRAVIEARQELVACGLEVAAAVRLQSGAVESDDTSRPHGQNGQ